MATRLRIVLLLTCLTLLASCSRLDLGYRNLDWLIPWSLDNYIPLSAEQKTWLKPRLITHINWHCTTQLPLYSDWLQRSAELAVAPDPAPAEFDAQFTAFRQAVDSVAVRLTPDATELLQGLSDQQVTALGENMAKQNKEQREEYLGVSLTEQIDERRERMEERLKPWFGRLQPEQKARVKVWAEQLGDYNEAWLDNNRRWQEAFLAAVKERHSEEFPEQVKRLLQDRMSFATPAYRERFNGAQNALADLFSDLVASADQQQRERLVERLQGARKQVSEMTCPVAA